MVVALWPLRWLMTEAISVRRALGAALNVRFPP